jgi:hypothetical protein
MVSVYRISESSGALFEIARVFSYVTVEQLKLAGRTQRAAHARIVKIKSALCLNHNAIQKTTWVCVTQ